MAADGERAALAAFVAQSVLAGGNAVGVRFSNRELAPLWGAGLRFALAAALLLAVMAALRLELPRGRALTGSVLYGLFNFGASFALIYYGRVRMHAGLGQILLALVPLATLLLALVWHQERVHPAAVVGVLLALVGATLMSRDPSRGEVPLASVLAVVGGAACFAQALVLVRRFPPVHPVTMNAVGMATGAAVLLVVLRAWAATRAAYTFVVVPFVTVLLSAWLDDEPVTIGLLLGGLLVLAGVYVGALRPRPATPAPVEQPDT